MTETAHLYQTDLLGPAYEQRTLSFPDDYEGQVIATLVRKKADGPTQKAVLYIHGFIDYFFQTEMAEQFNRQGYDFYALDLRKYERSHLPHQKFFNVRKLNEYDAEISQALEIIAEEDHHSVLLCGHSTGGLTTTLYAAHHPDHPLIKALWVNSPFYDFNMNIPKKKLGLPCLNQLGKYCPDLKFPRKWNQDAQTSDVILEVKDIIKYAGKLQGDVNVMTIKNGLHDLVLSAPEVRKQVYHNLFEWLNQKIS
ncbi:alpha/beta hydrolase [Acinetobacter sp. WZC-1]|uniref:alpha/beta hydrolase n=1 Tax=Acinetobacter sp. WZC-1 TaxID=3459034 RepID=UPI00403DCEB6